MLMTSNFEDQEEIATILIYILSVFFLFIHTYSFYKWSSYYV